MDPALITYLIPLLSALGGYVLRHYLPGLIPLPGGSPVPAPLPSLPLANHPLLSQLEDMIAKASRKALQDWLANAIPQAPATPKGL